MGTINPSFQDLSVQFFGNNVIVYTWAALGVGDDGAPVAGPGWADRGIHVIGTSTFGAGGTVVIEGSNDGTNWNTLDDPFGVPMSYTGSIIRQVVEVCLFIRPRITGGDGTTAITVIGVFGRHGPG